MLNNEYPPLGGGTGTVNKEILERLAMQNQHSIDLITGTSGAKKQTDQISSSVRIIYLPLKSKNIHHASNFELIKYSFKTIFESIHLHKTQKYDLSLAWSTVPAGFISWVLYKKYHLPYIVRVGGPDIPGFEKRYTTIYRLISPMIKNIWKKAGKLIVKCEMEKSMIMAINQKLNIHIINNGIDLKKFSFGIREPHKLPVIICAARLIQRKGQDILIQSIAKLKKSGIIAKLKLVGEGDEKDRYKNMSVKMDVADLVEFTGYVPREKMPQLYEHSDIFVLPSHNEGMSNALLEAMASALVVVVTDVGGTAELVKDNENGFIFPAGDADKLAEILEELIQNPVKRAEMGRKSREKAESFTWDNIVIQYNEVLHSGF